MDQENKTPDLAAENAVLKKRNEELEAGQKQSTAAELAIREKMAAGLTREQAVAALKQQSEYDKNLKALKKRKESAAK